MKYLFLVFIFISFPAGTFAAESISKKQACAYPDGTYYEPLEVRWTRGFTPINISFSKQQGALYYYVGINSQIQDGRYYNIASYLAKYSCNTGRVLLQRYYPRSAFGFNEQMPKITRSIDNSQYLLVSATYGSEGYMQGILDTKKMRLYHFANFLSSHQKQDFLSNFDYIRDIVYKDGFIQMNMGTYGNTKAYRIELNTNSLLPMN